MHIIKCRSQVVLFYHAWCCGHISMISRQMWKPPGLLLFVSPVWDDEVLYHRDKHAGWGTAAEEKRYRRAAREAPISSCKVRTINPALQIVAEGDFVCAAVSLLSKNKRWMELSRLLWAIYLLHHHRGRLTLIILSSLRGSSKSLLGTVSGLVRSSTWLMHWTVC